MVECTQVVNMSAGGRVGEGTSAVALCEDENTLDLTANTEGMDEDRSPVTAVYLLILC